ncbi:AGZA family xanthine/uracil permease-like MFS transporter [Lipingzhangella halophila]|uniref:AGZA family xanthine/uracil permease-like MFS transporter n=1 Tax=Lipingzhangella halophila TaxID=1783352 RepID=A0A7W7W5A8_9ACTN|nr:NCS2 family permease [Lipingzhangella halophila]MBB4934513.1 AGZA family xanthine/uracil permease-like MFS transporter [Lipingzhangella halophila]
MAETAEARSFTDRFFKISERGSTVGREVRGGLVTFFAMAYIVVLNPLIIGTVPDSTGAFLGGGAEPDLALVSAATALVAGVLTILMGVVANFPLALAAGLGLNAFVAFAVATQMTWADAMGLVVIEGFIMLVLVLSGFRKAVFTAVPRELKTGISVGIGLFIAFVGLVNGGFVSSTLMPTPPVELGASGSLAGWPVLVFCIGMLAVIILHTLQVRGAILWSIIGTSIIAVIVEQVGNIGVQDAEDPDANPTGWTLNAPELPGRIADIPDFSLLGQFSLLGSWDHVGVVVVVLLVFTLLLTDFFDTMGTMVAVGHEGGLLDREGNPLGSQRILVVDSLATLAGGTGAVSTNTSFVESSAGVGDGARTGLASVVTGVCFLLATFLSPLVAMVPNEAAAPALVLVGFLMMTQIRSIRWDDSDFAIPVFLTIILMPLAYSISVGIGAGFISYVVLKLVRGQVRAVHPLMWLVAALFVVYFAVEPIQSVLGGL